MSTYTTTLEQRVDDELVVYVNRNAAGYNTVARLDLVPEEGEELAAELTPEEAITIGRALIDAAGGINVLDRMGQLRRHDTAINAVADVTRIAGAEGANATSIIGRVLNGIRNYSLGGRRERAEAYAIAGLIDLPDHDLADQLEATGTAYIKVERVEGAYATVTVLPAANVIEVTA